MSKAKKIRVAKLPSGTHKAPRTEMIGIRVTKDQKRTLVKAANKRKLHAAELLQPSVDKVIEMLAREDAPSAEVIGRPAGAAGKAVDHA